MTGVRREDIESIRASGLFDSAWYLTEYPEVQALGMDPIEHFLWLGARLGRNPGPKFDTRLYLDLNEDVARAGVNPLLHYVRWGKNERRSVSRRLNAEVVNAGYLQLKGHRPIGGRRSVLAIAHAADENLGFFGGERSFLDILDGFSSLGVDVIATLPSNSEGYTEEVRKRTSEVLIFNYPLWNRSPVSKQTTRKFELIISEKRIDAVHVNTIVLREPLIAARNCDVPSVVHVRELIQYDEWLQAIIGETADSIIEQVLTRADWIVANSETTKRSFFKQERTFVVPNTVDTTDLDIPNDVDGSAVKFGIISSNIPKKGISDVVELASVCKLTIPNARFVIIGRESALVRELRARQKARQIPTTVQFPGYATSPREALQKVNVVLNFSHFAESFGRTVLEAMAARRPVIAYEWGALPELVVRDLTGFLIPFRQPLQALPAVKLLCECSEKIAEMGAAGRRIAEQRYSKREYARRLQNVYSSVFAELDNKRAHEAGEPIGKGGRAEILPSHPNAIDITVFTGAKSEASGRETRSICAVRRQVLPNAPEEGFGAGAAPSSSSPKTSRQGKFRSAPPPLPRPDSAGALEGITDGNISGWVAKAQNDDQPIEVEILVNNIAYKRVRANTGRPDIENAGPDRVAIAFSTTIDLGQFDCTLVHFSAQIAGSEKLLNTQLPAVQVPRSADKHHQARSVRPLLGSPKVTVVVPVFNAPAETKACIESVLAALPPWAELLISDDASSDPAISSVLCSFEGLHGVRIVRRPQNSGYTINVNEAIRSTPSGDILLLNSDTLVPPNWLRLLQRAAYSEERIGSVTALSDNAGAFSAPIPGEKNVLPAWQDSEGFARLVAEEGRRVYPTVPTGSGFCFYIRRDLLDAIGLFDEETFPRGYGEENDFCIRAERAGWRNIICDEVYVRHARSASFQDAKTGLIKRALSIISKRYPEYLRAVRAAFTDGDELCGIRYRIAHASLRRPDAARPRILFVLGMESGGTPETNLDLMSSIQAEFDPLLFLCDTRRGCVFRIVGREWTLMEEFQLERSVLPTSHDSPDYSLHISRILDDHKIELVHIRHLGRHGLSVIDNAKAKAIPVIHSFQDFYTICPNVKLVDAAGQHCEGTCTTGEMADCSVELWSSDKSKLPPLKHNWVRRWQSLMSSVLSKVDYFITTSVHTRNLITSIYPEIKGKPFDVIEHGRDFRDFHLLAAPLRADEVLRILIPGILTSAKGLDLIRSIKALDRENRLEFHFFGQEIEPLGGIGVSHGKYDREHFAERVQRIRPHVGAILSVWPETCSRTLTEMWACGIPVVVTAFGAPEERVLQHRGGWILSSVEPAAVYSQLLSIARDKENIAEKLQQVVQWQVDYGACYSVEAMSLHYRQVYRRLLRSVSRLPTTAAEPKLVYATHADPTRSADLRFGTGHTMPFLAEQLGSADIVIQIVSQSTLRCLPLLPPPDAVLIQCDGTGRLDKQTLTRLCARGGSVEPGALEARRWSSIR